MALKNVTLDEILNAVRDVYGYDFRKTAYGFYALPAGLRTKIFQVDYLNVRVQDHVVLRVLDQAHEELARRGIGDLDVEPLLARRGGTSREANRRHEGLGDCTGRDAIVTLFRRWDGGRRSLGSRGTAAR
jgi:hypothetical protein